MKNSPHHLKHLREKAIKEAQQEELTDISPEDMIENPHWKEQFEAKEHHLPHHPSHKHKKTSKRTSTKEVNGEKTEPANLQHENSHTLQAAQAKNKALTAKLNKKLSKKHMKAYKKAG